MDADQARRLIRSKRELAEAVIGGLASRLKDMLRELKSMRTRTKLSAVGGLDPRDEAAATVRAFCFMGFASFRFDRRATGHQFMRQSKARELPNSKNVQDHRGMRSVKAQCGGRIRDRAAPAAQGAGQIRGSTTFSRRVAAQHMTSTSGGPGRRR